MGDRALPPSVLLIEHDPERQLAFRAVLEGAGCGLRVAANANDGLRLWRSLHPDAVIVESALPDAGAIDTLREILAQRVDARVILVAPEASDEAAAGARDAGAAAFLGGPVDPARLLAALSAPLPAIAGPAGAKANDRGSRSVRPAGPTERAEPAGHAGPRLIGSSRAMNEVRRIIAAVAGSAATVFITGETGTGKEIAAQAIHAESPRAKGPFVALNSGAIPPDLLESEIFGHVKGSFTGAIADKPGAAASADGGTLFLDEICEMALPLQTKLLRFLETSTVQPVGATRPRHVDVRIVCATNRDPQQAVALGQFRDDLFYRLHVLPLHLPPLRERESDVVEVATDALARFAREEGKDFTGLTAEAEAALLSRPWPGNIRELLNVIRRLVVLEPGGAVTPAMLAGGLDLTSPGLRTPTFSASAFRAPAAAGSYGAMSGALPGETTGPTLPVMTLAEMERRAIEAALGRHGGSIPQAARELDVSPSTLYRKLAAWRGA